MRELIKSVPLYLLLIVGFLGCKTLPTQQRTEPIKEKEKIVEAVLVQLPTVLQIGNEKINSEAFGELLENYFINKNTNLDSLTKKIVFDKLVYKYAIENGFEKDESLENELKTYRNIMYDNYRQDSSLIKKMAFEAYQHLQFDVEVAHILIYKKPTSNEETAKNKFALATQIKAELDAGKSFSELAKTYSADVNSKDLGGYLGWFTGLQLIYPLEKAAYSLTIGEVSNPIETEFGYHLIKLLNKRPTKGRVTAKHILRVVPPNSKSETDSAQYKSILFIRDELNKGVEFEKLVSIYSDDYRTREIGGQLNEFWIGSREEKVVEDAVFNLEIGEISQPIRSSAGWHIFKLADKKPIPPYKSLEQELLQKVTTDSRGEFIEQNWLANAKENLSFKPNLSVISEVLKLGNDDLMASKWKAPTTFPFQNSFLFAIQGESISVKSFFSYLTDYQEKIKNIAFDNSADAIRYVYNKFENSIIKKYADANLETVNDDFRKAIQNYKEGIVQSTFLNENVFQKSVTDTTGLKNFYLKNQQKFQFPERANVTELICQDSASLRFIEGFLESEKPYNLKRGILPIYFSKNSWEIDVNEKARLKQLGYFLRKYPNYIIEIGGHSDINEADNVSNERLQQVISILLENGVDITRIKESDLGKTQPINRFDWQRNQRVTFRFLSNAIKDVERIGIDLGYVLEVNVHNITKSDIKNQQGIDWKIGSYTTTLSDGKLYKLIINEIYPARQKSFKEAKTELIKAYQEELTKQLFEKMQKIYPVNANENLIKSIYKSKLD